MNWGKTAVWRDNHAFFCHCFFKLVLRQKSVGLIKSAESLKLIEGFLRIEQDVSCGISQMISTDKFYPSDNGSGHYALSHNLGFYSNPPFYCMGTAIVFMIWAWPRRGVRVCECKCVWAGWGWQVSVRRGAKPGLMTSSLWVWSVSPSLPTYTHTGGDLAHIPPMNMSSVSHPSCEWSHHK